jgi:hypothetical protein
MINFILDAEADTTSPNILTHEKSTLKYDLPRRQEEVAHPKSLKNHLTNNTDLIHRIVGDLPENKIKVASPFWYERDSIMETRKLFKF